MIFQVRLTDWGLEDTNKTVICLVKNLPKQHSQLDIEIMVCQQSLFANYEVTESYYFVLGVRKGLYRKILVFVIILKTVSLDNQLEVIVR